MSLMHVSCGVLCGRVASRSLGSMITLHSFVIHSRFCMQGQWSACALLFVFLITPFQKMELGAVCDAGEGDNRVDAAVQ